MHHSNTSKKRKILTSTPALRTKTIPLSHPNSKRLTRGQSSSTFYMPGTDSKVETHPVSKTPHLPSQSHLHNQCAAFIHSVTLKSLYRGALGTNQLLSTIIQNILSVCMLSIQSTAYSLGVVPLTDFKMKMSVL